MSILARFQNHPVEVIDVFPGSSGIKLATVRALQGKPFMSWTHGGWCESDTANLPAELLKDVSPPPQPDNQPDNTLQARNLLDLALAQERPQWQNGESVWIWHDSKSRNGGKSGAFLKAYSGEVCLHLTGFTPALRVFWLDVHGWQVCRNVRADYQSWAAKAREALK